LVGKIILAISIDAGLSYLWSWGKNSIAETIQFSKNRKMGNTTRGTE
jgi:hypothetical protein